MADRSSPNLKSLIEYAYTHAPAVRARMDAAGVQPDSVNSVDDLARIPILTKDELLKLQQADPPFGGLLAVPLSEIRHVFMSPGPIYEPDAGADETVVEVGQIALRMAGFTPEDVVLNTLSYHLVPAGLLFDHALSHMGCTIVPSGFGNTELQLKLMGDLGVTAYIGTPSFLITLIRKAEEMGLDFNQTFKLDKAIVTAEPLPPSLRETLVDTYGIQVTNAYGTAELGIVALNTQAGITMSLLPYPIVQIVDPDTGQTVGPGEVGEIVVTNFNRAYPLIRFGTGDMAIKIDPLPGESQQSEREIIIVGRRGEAVKVRGMFVHPRQMAFAVEQVAKGANVEVTAVQGVITRPIEQRDHFLVRIASSADPTTLKSQAAAFKQAIQQACRVRADKLEFVAADAIAADAAGMVDKRSWD